MKAVPYFLLACSFLSGGLFADGFGFNIGPFNMQFNVDDGNYITVKRNTLDGPICQAIQNLNRVEITVEGTEVVSAKEKKIVTKRLLVEPYAFGVTRDGKPVLRGNIVEEKLVREVSVKFGEARFEEPFEANKDKPGFFSGLFRSDKNQNIDIRKISDIKVLTGIHFDAPRNYKGIQDDNIQVICQLPIDN